jgi:serine/threonine protein kinase/Tfp pilus assembly protein PilF
MSLIGKTIGHIRVTGELGSGGMGDVYVGLDETLGRKVAIKAIRAKHRLSPKTKARFLREARVLSQLEHPHICQIYDYIEGKESDFLVLEFIEGKSLQQEIKKDRDKSQKLKIAEQIAQVLVKAHEKGVVHRDLKPSNVMLAKNNQVKVLDFGLAGYVKSEHPVAPAQIDPEIIPAALDHTLTMSESPPHEEPLSESPMRPAESFKTEFGSIMGTPLYMSPEQARGETASAASDMYSFGLLLQQLFTGLEPYEETEDLSSLLEKAMKAETKPVTGVSSDLASLINRLKSLVPTARPSATETAGRLRQIREKPKKRIRKSIVSAVVMAFLLLGLKYMMDLRRERRLALQARDEATNVVKFLVNLFEVSDPGEARGNTITAKEILNKGAREIAQGLQEQPLTQARLMDTIGTVYMKLGLYEESESLLRDALEIREKHLDKDDAQVAESFYSLSLLLEQQAKFDDAEQAAKRSLAIREKLYSPAHRDIAASLHALARIYHKQSKWNEAEPLYQRSLEMRERILGPNHPDVAESLNDMGVLNYMLARYEEAEKCYQRALSIRETVLGPDHPDLGRNLNSLASLYLSLHRYSEAELLYKRALVIREKTLGPVHPDVAICLNNIALLFYYQGNFSEAEKYYKQALEIRQKSLGENHPDVAVSLETLAGLYHRSGDYEKARSLYDDSIAVKEKSLGPDTPELISALNNSGILHIEMGGFDQAEKLVKRALRITKKAFGQESKRVAEGLMFLGYIYSSTERFDEAEQEYQRALLIRERELGQEHPELASVLNGLGHVCDKKGQYDEAEQYFLRALNICEKNPNSNPEAKADSLHNLGVLYFHGLGLFEKAESFFKRALSFQEEIYGPESPQFAETVKEYSDLLRKLGRPNEAEALEKERREKRLL